VIDLGGWSGPLAYLAVFVATVVEGEVVFVAASVLVHAGRLNGAGVFTAAALGGSLGDQAYFYALRGRLRRWLQRFPWLAARGEAVIGHVRAHGSAAALLCRFLPGLRVAIPAACAWAEVPAVTFTTLSLVSSLAWAAVVMALVAWLGPASLEELGAHGWWVPLLPAAVVLAGSVWLGRRTRPRA
jgi:membrane protein DedA with SNARE-associated domain